MEKTSRGNRLHIGLYGRTNVGKSTFLNKITNQEISIVSEVEGTTTDIVYKPMELLPVGPVVFMDTAGLDDKTELSKKRTQKTLNSLDKVDVSIVASKFGGGGHKNASGMSCEGRIETLIPSIIKEFARIM